MLDAARLYLRYVGSSVHSQMQYKASFLMLSLGHLLNTGLEFLAIWLLFARFGSLQSWRLAEVAFFYGLANVAFAFTDASSRGFDILGDTIKSGDLDRLLLRPRSLVLQLAGQELTLRRIGRLAQGCAVLLWAASALQLRWTLTRLTLAISTLLGSACLFYGLIVLQATMAFWTVETLELVNAFTYGGVFAAQYPMAIYRGWLLRFYIYVIPLACVSYFPVVAILGRADPLGTPAWLGWVSPLAGPAFLLLALQAFRMGVRHYTSTGS